MRAGGKSICASSRRSSAQQQALPRPVTLMDLAPHTTWASLSTPVKATVAENWSLISNRASENDAHVSARRCADITAAEQAVSKVEELAFCRKTAATEAQAAADSAEQESARAREALQRARAEGAKRQRGDTAAATTSAPPATSTAAMTISAPRAASNSSVAPFAALAARLVPPPHPPFNEVTVRGRRRGSGHNAFFSRQCRVHGAQSEICLRQGGGDGYVGQRPRHTGGAVGRAPLVRRWGLEAHVGGQLGGAEDGGNHYGAGDEPADRSRPLLI